MDFIKEEIYEDYKLSLGKCEDCDHGFTLLSNHRWLYHRDPGGVLKERVGDDDSQERVYNKEEDVLVDWDNEDGIPQCVFCGCHFPNTNSLFNHLLALHDPTSKISQGKDGEGEGGGEGFGNERVLDDASSKEDNMPRGEGGGSGREGNEVKRVCHICQQSNFKDVFSLWDHLEKHPILHIYPCSFCPFTTATRLAMVIHGCKRKSKRLSYSKGSLRESVESLLIDIPDLPGTFENDLMTLPRAKKKNNVSRIRTPKKKSSFQRGKVKDTGKKDGGLKVVLGRQSMKRMMWKMSGGNKCSICKSTFKDQRAILEHRLVEHRHFVCPECGKQLRNRKTMKAHLATMHGPGKYLLEVPLDLKPNAEKKEEIEIPSTVKLELNAETLFTCTLCDYKTHLRYRLDEHRRNKHGGPYECYTCSKNFLWMSSLDAHYRAAHDERYHFECNSCSTVFRRKLLLLSHLKKGKNKCPICKEFYPCVTSLEEHANSMHAFNCPICKKRFETLRRFRHHNTNTHGIKNRLKCPICGHTTNSDFNLKRHRRRAHGERFTRKRGNPD